MGCMEASVTVGFFTLRVTVGFFTLLFSES